MGYSRSLAAAVVLFIIFAPVNSALSYDDVNHTYFPILTPPTNTIYNVLLYGPDSIAWGPAYECGNPSMCMLSSLAGLLVKNEDEDGLYFSSNDDGQFILNELVAEHNITCATIPSASRPWEVAVLFQDVVSNYVVYDASGEPDSLNVARMASYKYNAIMVDVVLEATMENLGYSEVFSCLGKNDLWIYNNWLNDASFTKNIAVEQTNNYLQQRHHLLHDVSSAMGGLAFFDGSSTSLRRDFLDAMPDDSLIFGWADFDEIEQMTENSERGVTGISANYCYNQALLASFRDTGSRPQTQPNHPTTPSATNKHYVCFLMTDGDNIQWFNTGFLLDSKWWGSPSRGKYPINWGYPPTMNDGGQIIIDYLYGDATIDSGSEDYFVAYGPVGYGYPNLFSSSHRIDNATRLNGYMADEDLSVLAVVDKFGFANAESVYGPYLAEDNIDGILYMDSMGDYGRYDGYIKWASDCPIISCYDVMWEDVTTNAEVAVELNARSTDSTTMDAYSLVAVHVWTKSVTDIVDVADDLDSDVEVVTAEEFVELIKTNVVRTPTPTPGGESTWVEKGDWQLGTYGTPSHEDFTVTVDSSGQQVDGTNSTKFEVGTNYGEVNMSFSDTDVSDAFTVEWDMYGDDSGVVARFKFWSDTYQAFLYDDVEIDWPGWRHMSHRMDGSDGLDVYGDTRDNVASALDIFQVGAPWSGGTSTFYVDNVVFQPWMTNTPIATNTPTPTLTPSLTPTITNTPTPSDATWIEKGDWQLGAYGTPSVGGWTVTVDSSTQQVDGTNSTEFDVPAKHGEVNMSFTSLDAGDLYSVTWDMYSDNSDIGVRVKFWSSTYSAFLYDDITLSGTGWTKYTYKLDCTDGMSYYGDTLENIKSDIDIFQIGAPWPGTEAASTFYVDNVAFLPWITNTPTPTPTAGPEVVFEDDFSVSSWSNWDGNGATDWEFDSGTYHDSSYAASRVGAYGDDDLLSDDIDLSSYRSFTVDFWYRVDDIDANDDVMLQFYDDGSSYDNIDELGDDAEDVWLHYNDTFTSSQYLHSGFHIKFEGSSTDYGENLWIDDLEITAE